MNQLRERILETVVAAWAIMLVVTKVFIEALPYNKEYSKNFNLITNIAIMVAIGVIIACVDYIFNKIKFSKMALFAGVSAYLAILMGDTDEKVWLYGAVLVELFLVYYLRNDSFGFRIKDNKVKIKLAYVVLGVLIVAGIGGYTAMKYLSFRSPNFDFGIFANMYYNMKESFLPMVSSERDKLLSHFAVHFSPIVYIALPFYMIFPSPVTVQLIQAFALALGLIPIYLLGKEYKLSNKTLATVGFLYMLYPALAGACSYDFHENCFLTPALLFLMWAMEKKKTGFIVLFGILSCMVKEDAPVYVAIIGIYYIFSNKSKLRGSILTVGAVIYFVVVTALMKKYGLGVMTYRYDNIVPMGSQGFMPILKASFANPMLLISECFTVEKLDFVFFMLAPIAGLSFANKKVSNFILLIPFFLINLISDYQYQHSIYFQYTFGVTALFFYLMIINIKEMKPLTRRNVLRFAVAVSIILFVFISPKYIKYFRYYVEEQEMIQELNETLDELPKDASVAASTFLVAKISDREEIYEYPSKNETEYIVIDERWSPLKPAAVEKIKRTGYEVVVDKKYIIILKKK